MDKLFGVAVKAAGSDFWTVGQRWFSEQPDAQEWAIQTWSGTGCATQIICAPLVSWEPSVNG